MAAKRNQPETTGEIAEEMREENKTERILAVPVQEMRPAQRAVYEMLTLMEQIATEDQSEEVTGEDIARILLAETDDEMWEADELPRLNAKVLSGCEMEVYGFDVKYSNSSDSEIKSFLIAPQSRKKMYLLVRAARLNNSGDTVTYRLPDVGEEFQWNTSARFIVAKLFRMMKSGKFDNGGTVKCRIQGTKLGDGGKSVEKLKPIGAPVTVSHQDTTGFDRDDNQPPF